MCLTTDVLAQMRRLEVMWSIDIDVLVRLRCSSQWQGEDVNYIVILVISLCRSTAVNYIVENLLGLNFIVENL